MFAIFNVKHIGIELNILIIIRFSCKCAKTHA